MRNSIIEFRMLNVEFRISRCSLPAIDQGSTIDITPMTNVKNRDIALRVINVIDDTIGSYADAPSRPTCQRQTPGRARLMR
jgi:hypothetical protein